MYTFFDVIVLLSTYVVIQRCQKPAESLHMHKQSIPDPFWRGCGNEASSGSTHVHLYVYILLKYHCEEYSIFKYSMWFAL